MHRNSVLLNKGGRLSGTADMTEIGITSSSIAADAAGLFD